MRATPLRAAMLLLLLVGAQSSESGEIQESYDDSESSYYSPSTIESIPPAPSSGALVIAKLEVMGINENTLLADMKMQTGIIGGFSSVIGVAPSQTSITQIGNTKPMAWEIVTGAWTTNSRKLDTGDDKLSIIFEVRVASTEAAQQLQKRIESTSVTQINEGLSKAGVTGITATSSPTATVATDSASDFSKFTNSTESTIPSGASASSCGGSCIAGAVIGTLFGIALLCALAHYFCRVPIPEPVPELVPVPPVPVPVHKIERELSRPMGKDVIIHDTDSRKAHLLHDSDIDNIFVVNGADVTLDYDLGILLSHYNFEVTETADSGQCVEQGIIIGDCLVGIEGETLASLQINSVDEFISEVVARPKPCTLNFNAINVKADSPYKVSRRELDADKYVEKNLHKRNEPMPLSAFIEQQCQTISQSQVERYEPAY